jgi:O-antigen biosynthesis protein
MSVIRPRVHVVLATFEPRPDWLQLQVATILAQEGVEVSLDVTDDGSGTDTGILLEQLCAADPRCRWTTGARLGSAANFARGLARAPRDVDAILLADQDDVWEPDKAAVLVATLAEGHLLAHSDARLIDADGALLPGTLFEHEGRDATATTQESLVVRNVVTGCTAALRPEVLEAALPFPSLVGGAVHHDLWLALCAAGRGTIGTVRRPLLGYRQHGANVVGAVTGYGRFRGPREAAGSWALRRHIAEAVVAAAAAGRLPSPAAGVTAWTGPRPELATLPVLARLARTSPGSRALLRTLRVGALTHLGHRIVRAPLTTGRRWLRLTVRGLRLLGFIARNPRRMLGGIARSAGVVDRPLRTVSATVHDPQQRAIRAQLVGAGRSVHVLIPGVSPSGVFGGVATAVALGVALAERGEQVSLVMTDYGQSLDDATVRRLILRHVDTRPEVLERIRIHRAIHDDTVLDLGADDVLLATAWWTAFRAAATIAAHPGLVRRRFAYLVQDDETLFYPASERSIMAERSYRFDALHVVNSVPLAAHLRDRHHIDAEPDLVLAPLVAVPQRLPLRAIDGPLRVVVYGRPSVGRNLFDAALRGIAMWEATRRAGGAATPIEVVSVGEPEQFRYRIGETMVRAPGVLSWEAYLALLAQAHLGVSLMTSPHPSYPPLEMATSGLVVVTNRWGPKDLGLLSQRFVSCEPDAAGVAAALAEAERRHAGGGDPALDLTPLGRPLDVVADRLHAEIVAGG